MKPSSLTVKEGNLLLHSIFTNPCDSIQCLPESIEVFTKQCITSEELDNLIKFLKKFKLQCGIHEPSNEMKHNGYFCYCFIRTFTYEE